MSVQVTFLHGTGDRTAPAAAIDGLVDDLVARGKYVDLRVVPGDHHLAVRRPAKVAAILAELLDTPEAAA